MRLVVWITHHKRHPVWVQVDVPWCCQGYLLFITHWEMGIWRGTAKNCRNEKDSHFGGGCQMDRNRWVQIESYFSICSDVQRLIFPLAEVPPENLEIVREARVKSSLKDQAGEQTGYLIFLNFIGVLKHVNNLYWYKKHLIVSSL